MGRWQQFSIPVFGGLNEDENPHSLAPTDLSIAENVWALGNGMGTRPGTIVEPDGDYASALGSDVHGIACFTRDRDANRDLVVVIPGAIHTASGTTLTANGDVQITNSAGKRWTFAIGNGNTDDSGGEDVHFTKLYAAGGDVDGGDTAWRWDGTNNVTKLSIKNLAGDADLEPRYIFQWANRIWAGGFDGDDLAGNPGLVRFSELNDGDHWPQKNSVGGNFSIGGFAPDGSEYVTGFGSYTDNNGRWLIVGTNQRLYSLAETGSAVVPFRITDEIPNGLVHQNAFINPGVDSGDAFYMSEYGIHSLKRSQQFGARAEAFLSHKIRKTIGKINRTRLDQVVSAYWNEYGLAMWSFPTGSSTTNDTIVVLDVRRSIANEDREITAESAIWYIWRLAGSTHVASSFAFGRDASDNEQHIYLGDSAGNVCVFSDTTNSDLGSPFSAHFRTKHSYFSAPTREKVLGDVFVDVGSGSTTGGTYRPKFQAIMDFGTRPMRSLDLTMPPSGAVFDVAIFDQDRFGSENAIKRNKLYAVGRGDLIAFDFQHVGAGEPFYVYGVFGDIIGMGEGTQA